jgi:hypothetical protein
VYERLPVMLYAMKAKNSGMHFEYVPKPEISGQRGDNISSVYFGHLDSAWKHSSIVVMCCQLMTRS